MAEGDVTVYNSWKELIMEGGIDLATGGDSIQVSLHTGYTPNIDTHIFWDDVSATDYSTASGYTAEGKLAGNQDVTVDTTDDEGVFDFDDVVWTSLGALSPATPSHAIVWKDTGTPSTSPLIAYIELGATATNGGNYTLTLDSEGFINLT